MNVNTDMWGTSYVVYDDMNIRTGTSAITDSDYTDYPPFVKSDLSVIGTDGNPDPTHFENDCIYIAYLNSPRLSDTGWYPSNEMDLTIAYCACRNPELLICNPIVLGVCPDEYTIDGNYNYTAPNQHKAISMERTGTKITPIVFKNNETYARHRPNKGVYPLTGTEYIPYYAASSASSHKANSEMNLWTPDGGISENAGTETSSQRSAINNNAWISYWRDFGIRTIFGVIKVIYFDGTYSSVSGTPQNVVQSPVSLHYYESQTTEWKAQHPILGAYLDIYHRSNVDGTYTAVKFNNRCFVADILVGLRMTDKWRDHADEYVWQPASCLRDDCSSFFPIFGPAALGARVDTSITGTVMIGTQLSNYPVSKDCEPLIGYIEHSMLHVGFKYSGSSNNPYKTFWLELEGTDANLELLRRSAAGYGLFFADDEYNLADSGRDSTRWTDPNMCLGVVDRNGYTDGTYTKGSENTDANNFLWKTASESTYDPSRPPPSPDNTYSTATTFNSIGDLATLTKRYVLTASAVQQLGTALWDISAALSDNGADFSELTEKSLDMFLTNNPIDAIISLQRYPMEIPSVGTTTVKLGKTDTGISAKPMEKTAYFYLFSGSVIHPRFGDSFLDYQPYTKMELYIPFCGTIQMNPADIINRTLNVQLVVDFTTGTATGFIMSDDLVIETVNGNIAIDIPVTGLQAATVASQLNNAIANKSNKTLEAQSASLGNISAGGVIRALKDPIKMIYGYQEAKNEQQRAEYDLTHQNAPIHIIGSASAVGGWAIDLQCRLIIYYPSGDVIRTAQPPEWDDLQLARYGRTTGFACCIESNITSMTSGLVVGINPDLNGMITNVNSYPATAAELDMLRAAIGEGVIL